MSGQNHPSESRLSGWAVAGLGLSLLGRQRGAGGAVQFLLPVVEVGAVSRPQTVAGVGQQAAGFVARHLLDRHRQARQGGLDLGGPSGRLPVGRGGLDHDKVGDGFDGHQHHAAGEGLWGGRPVAR